MKFKYYLKGKGISIALVLFAIIATAILCWIIEVRPVFIVFIESIFIIMLLIATIMDYIKRKKFYDYIDMCFNQLDKKTLLSEVIHSPNFFDGDILIDILKKSNKYMNDVISNLERESREYREYVEMWVHEVKTPITSIGMMLDNNKNPVTFSIHKEIDKIEKYVEQALFYARITSLEKDFKIEKISLRKLCTDSVKDYSRQIVQCAGKVIFNNLDISVHADKKWCQFIIGQIIANAVKYRSDNLVIEFSAAYELGKIKLMIIDNGIGVRPEDLEKVFEKGFIGSNARKYTKSTGIGLYLCKRMCDKMNLQIELSSEFEQSTKVCIYFPQNEFYI